jgi:PleD family two-component response regulator
MEAGAWDFATQPFDGPLLLARIRTFLQAKAALDASLSDATLDSATGLYNRRGLARRLPEMWADARRRGEGITFLAFSVQPPEVLQTFHLGSDAAVSIAHALRASVRASDTIARIWPLEFAILSPGLDEVEARRVIERVQRFLAVALGAGAVPMRTSIIALRTDEPLYPDQLLQRGYSLAAGRLAELSSSSPAR